MSLRCDGLSHEQLVALIALHFPSASSPEELEAVSRVAQLSIDGLTLDQIYAVFCMGPMSAAEGAALGMGYDPLLPVGDCRLSRHVPVSPVAPPVPEPRYDGPDPVVWSSWQETYEGRMAGRVAEAAAAAEDRLVGLRVAFDGWLREHHRDMYHTWLNEREGASIAMRPASPPSPGEAAGSPAAGSASQCSSCGARHPL